MTQFVQEIVRRFRTDECKVVPPWHPYDRVLFELQARRVL